MFSILQSIKIQTLFLLHPRIISSSHHLIISFFPPYPLRTRVESEQEQVWDPVRKKWIAHTPEEHVRQLLIRFLQEEKSIPAGLIGVEKEISYFHLRKRFDVVVFDSSGKPLVLCECKAPAVALSQDTLYQISRYNATIQAPHLLLTNGLGLLFFSRDENGKYHFRKEGWWE